jgi:hypothetical protein
MLNLHTIGPHNKDILDILIGSLLGDGSMEKDCFGPNAGSRFVFYQEKPNGEYLLYLHNEIARLGYCKPNLPQINSRRKNDSYSNFELGRDIGKCSDSDSIRYFYRFRTFTYTSFN